MQSFGPLITADQLLRRIDDPSLRVCDVRWYLGRPDDGRRAYAAGHIPGAVFVDLDADLAASQGPGRHPLPDPGVVVNRLGELGIGDDSLVVAYDDVGGSIAARLWWMLDDLGHRAVAVLDGGIAAWTAAGGSLTSEPARHPRAHLSLADRWTHIVDRDELRRRLGTVVLLDARARERYRGDFEPVDPVAGHIPTAVNAPFGGNLIDGRFRTSAELAARFEALGATDREVVSSCGSGVNACHNALAMRIAELPDPILYPGSFSDWSRSGLYVAVGDEPGTPAELRPA